jgi:hypothetical protein
VTIRPHIAVLGAGIMGSATALFLARRRARITLFDAAPAPFHAASRWNEGKIHVGYLYSADPSLQTARRLLPGGLAFRRLTEQLLGTSLDPAVAAQDECYLVHRDSVTTAAATGRYLGAVSALAATHPEARDYLVPLHEAHARPLSAAELAAHYDPSMVVAGYRVPERSVSTAWIADRFVETLGAEPRIELAMQTRVHDCQPVSDAHDRWYIHSSNGRQGPFDFVVNALWEGRPAIDAALGLLPPAPWTHRFRVSLFVRTRHPVTLPSMVLATGPFGDIKNYNGRDLYLSWYPAGLLAEGGELAPPAEARMDETREAAIRAAILENLGRVAHGVRGLEREAETIRVAGGWVYAVGRGSLDDSASTLHRRDQVGTHRLGSYISVDTGKYSIAPWLARQVADAICEA